MLILKFGGTSVRDAARWRRAAAIVDERRDDGAVVVVSAAAGMTRRLLDLAAMAARGRSESIDAELAEIAAIQRTILDDLRLAAAEHAGVAAELEGLLADLRVTVGALIDPETLRGREATPALARVRAAGAGGGEAAGKDLVMSFGERFSSALMAAAGRAAGLPIARVSALDIIVTDARFRDATPDRGAIEQLVAARVAPRLDEGAVVVTEGFIGVTPGGAVTTMGFEASDLTAALLGAALDAEQVQIWTDVPGMLTTGHASVPEPRRVPRLSYDEAAELALFGARVLHPDTVAPARAKGIPVRILNAAEPAGEGTWIGDDRSPDGADGDRPAVVKAIAVAEDADDESFTTVRALLARAGAGRPGDRAVVCPVGRGIGDAPQLIDRIDHALDGFPSTRLLPRRPHAIPVVVARRHLDEVVRRLHAAFFSW